MASGRSVRLSYPYEPAHPMVIEYLEDLVAIYTRLKELQPDIDSAFDRASRQIGYVVVTTLPVTMQIGDRGAVQSIAVGADHLKGTLFEQEIVQKTLKGVAGKPVQRLSSQDPVPPRSYNVYVLWKAALELKLLTDWMEPAHLSRFVGGPQLAIPAQQMAQLKWEAHEPAHWFDPGIALGAEDALQIEAIDRVYTDLHLADRVASLRRVVRPEVREPAHFHTEPVHLAPPEVREPAHFARPEVREPAHLAQIEQGLQSDKGAQLAAELTALLKKYGY